MTGPRRPGNAPPSRRADDGRMEVLSIKVSDVVGKVDKIEAKVEAIEDKVDAVHQLLITEPEASALGRNLLARSLVNAGRLDKTEPRLDVLEAWLDQERGRRLGYVTIAATASLVGTVLGVVVSVLVIISRVG